MWDPKEEHRKKVDEVIYAAEAGDVKLLSRRLGQSKKLLDEKDLNGCTALARAAEAGQGDAVRFLLDQGADLVKCDPSWENALHRASRKGHSAVCKQLLDKGAEAGAANREERTALHHAASNGHAETIQVLVQYGAKPNVADQAGRTPLHLAVAGDKAHAVHALLEVGADVAVKDERGHTALKNASWFMISVMWFHSAATGNVERVKQLLGHQVGNDAGFENLSRALFNPRDRDEDLLRAHKQLINLKHPSMGHSAIGCAILERHEPVARYLLSQDADVHEPGDGRNTPLHLAVRRGSAELVQALVDANAPLNAQNDGEATPLHVAAHYGNVAAIEVLLASRVALEVKDAMAYTPLHYAAAQGHVEATKALALAGASLNARDKTGKRPHDKAAEYRAALMEPRPRRAPVAA